VLKLYWQISQPLKLFAHLLQTYRGQFSEVVTFKLRLQKVLCLDLSFAIKYTTELFYSRLAGLNSEKLGIDVCKSFGELVISNVCLDV